VSLHVVVRERGPRWDPARPMREQDGWDDHAAFMDALTAERFVLLGGPVGDGERRFLLVVDAADEAEIAARLDEDPWMPSGMLRLIEIQPWTLLLGRAP
jgi:uncharacterized protein YciI